MRRFVWLLPSLPSTVFLLRLWFSVSLPLGIFCHSRFRWCPKEYRASHWWYGKAKRKFQMLVTKPLFLLQSYLDINVSSFWSSNVTERYFHPFRLEIRSNLLGKNHYWDWHMTHPKRQPNWMVSSNNHTLMNLIFVSIFEPLCLREDNRQPFLYSIRYSNGILRKRYLDETDSIPS